MSELSKKVEEIKGFLLTRQWADVKPSAQQHSLQSQAHLQIVLWFNSIQGPIKAIFNDQRAVAFIDLQHITRARKALTASLGATSENSPAWQEKPLALRSFDNKPVTGLYFREQGSLYRARDLLAQHQITLLEADISPADRFLMERFITGSACLQGTFEQCDGYLEVTNPRVKKAAFEPAFSVVSLDIETSMQGDQLYSIAALAIPTKGKNQSDQADEQRRVFMVGSPNSNSAISTSNKPDYLVYCRDERSLMLAFMDWFNDINPDVITGWNVINFDLRFLQRKADTLKLPLNLGRGNCGIIWRQSRGANQHYTVLVPGRAVLDGIDTLKSATYTFESFSLQYVANMLLKRGKLIHDNDNRGEEITRLFNEEKLQLAAYNLEDCQLVWDILQKTDLINAAVQRAQHTGLALDRYGGSVAAFCNRYLPLLHRRGFISPNLPVNPDGVGSPGGYVMNSQPGIYNHVLVLDFKSLYPSIIRTFKVDPLGLAIQDHAHNTVDSHNTINSHDNMETTGVDIQLAVPGFKGAVFSKTDNILPDIIAELWSARDQAKKENNAAASQSVKILMNSFYGVLGTPGCRFFDPRLPSSITLRGHDIMTTSKRWIESKGHQVIYGDTDSVFVWLQNDQDKTAAQIRQIGADLSDGINRWWQHTVDEKYHLKSYLEIEFETHFRRFIMPTIRGSDKGSKKRYAGVAAKETDSEQGHEELVFKGLETVRTDWTPLAREFQRELYRRIFFDEPYEDYIKDTVAKVRAGEHDVDLVYRKRLRRRLSDYVRNVPPHVQAARRADEQRVASGLAAIYQHGGWIQYVITVAGPQPLAFIQDRLDYDLYIERQIEPIVDGIVHFLGSSFKNIMDQQLNLFS